MLLVPVAPSAVTRVIGTVYQPNLVRPTLVTITVLFQQPANAAGTIVTAECDANNPPTTVANACACSLTAGAGEEAYSYVPMTFLVPPSYYYRLVQGGAGATIYQANEQTL